MNTTKTFSVIALLLAVISLAVGYAALSNINLKISGTAGVVANENNFKVHLADLASGSVEVSLDSSATGTITVNAADTSKATFSVLDLTNKDEYVDLKVNVVNESEDINAKISAITITPTGEHDYSDYIEVTTFNLAVDDVIEASSSKVLGIRVKLAKVVTDDISGSFEVSVTAAPVEAQGFL